ncbi:Ribose 5-phosphate isomerase B [hydrothermal vent metagenome]|uniref:Ribose 5-phosphate isomerase B n=1 Tax=hydrothermal vent metagenome TaxID=652676 RepID=A0A3B1CHI7_9ZZZZ
MKKVITEIDVINLYRSGTGTVKVDRNTIVTPAARDKLNDLKIKVISSESEPKKEITDTWITKKKVAIGSDHTGYRIKEKLKEILNDNGFNIVDVGTSSEDSCDYPDYAKSVAVNVIDDSVDFGIIVDATGIPSAISANKVNGIRAATCYNEFSAWSARAHNNANILVVGAKTLGEETIKSILDKFMNTNFEGGRHQRRLDKITLIEKENS